MTSQDREAFEAVRLAASRWDDEEIPRCHPGDRPDYCTGIAMYFFEAGLAHARKQTAELRAMLDELLLSVQGENIYLCDDVWAVADRITAQLKEQSKRPIRSIMTTKTKGIKTMSESYPEHWKHCTIHLNPETGEMHSDGDHSVRQWIEGQIRVRAEAIAKHNEKMDRVPSMEKCPQNAADGLRFLAKWFDAMYQDDESGDDTVQKDLRSWADAIDNLNTSTV